MNARVPRDDTTLRSLDQSFPSIPEVKIVAEIGHGGMAAGLDGASVLETEQGRSVYGDGGERLSGRGPAVTHC